MTPCLSLTRWIDNDITGLNDGLKVEVGFNSPSTGIVTLLATAHLVAEALKTSALKAGVENILFLLIHGESFDYIGSSRLVYDMQHQAFPFNLSQVLALPLIPIHASLRP